MNHEVHASWAKTVQRNPCDKTLPRTRSLCLQLKHREGFGQTLIWNPVVTSTPRCVSVIPVVSRRRTCNTPASPDDAAVTPTSPLSAARRLDDIITSARLMQDLTRVGPSRARGSSAARVSGDDDGLVRTARGPRPDRCNSWERRCPSPALVAIGSPAFLEVQGSDDGAVTSSMESAFSSGDDPNLEAAAEALEEAVAVAVPPAPALASLCTGDAPVAEAGFPSALFVLPEAVNGVAASDRRVLRWDARACSMRK